MPPVFVLTIDTEGDNLWSRPATITTENARHLPRFQALCEEFGFRPSYLVTYEMAMDPAVKAFGRCVLRSRSGEIGLHLHAWNSPPLTGGPDPRWHYVYLYELPDEVIHAKLDYMTRLLADVFEIRPVSHRGGRWGLDERVARMLVDHGYTVDCSVTPGVSHKRYKGDPAGHGGPAYGGFPMTPYFLDLDDIRRAGASTLLEAPVTIRPNFPAFVEQAHQWGYDGLLGKALRGLLGAPYTWLRPNGKNLERMLALVDWCVERELPLLEFVLHSSELMAGGSPSFRTGDDVEALYRHLRRLFGHIAARGARPMTLAEYRATWAEPGATVRSHGSARGAVAHG